MKFLFIFFWSVSASYAAASTDTIERKDIKKIIKKEPANKQLVNQENSVNKKLEKKEELQNIDFYNNKCTNYSCSMASDSNCYDENNKFEVARACSKIKDLSCVKSVCQKLGLLGCDEFKEVLNVVKLCQNT